MQGNAPGNHRMKDNHDEPLVLRQRVGGGKSLKFYGLRKMGLTNRTFFPLIS